MTYDEARAACDEYVRRAQKRIPSDRWVDGTDGAERLARAMHLILATLDDVTTVAATLANLQLEQHQRTIENMGPGGPG